MTLSLSCCQVWLQNIRALYNNHIGCVRIPEKKNGMCGKSVCMARYKTSNVSRPFILIESTFFYSMTDNPFNKNFIDFG